MSNTRLVAIVDDDESARKALTGLVKAFGFATAAFCSAGEFLGSPERQHTAVLIADVQMPDMTGLEFFYLLIQSDKKIPTILITAHPNDEIRRRALQAGVHAYLPKPIDSDTLFDCLHLALRQDRGDAG
ncbi:MAG: response regulator transcription factor [Kiloniellaceae bacterium]